MTPAAGLRVLSRSPDLRVQDGFLSPAEIAHALAIGADLPSLAARGVEIHEDETGLSFEMPIEGDPVLEGIRARLEALLRYESALGYTFRYRRYAPGQGHPPHLDCYAVDEYELLATALLTLQAPEEGGDTVFPRAEGGEIRVAPAPGRMLLWFNHLPDGARDPASWHAGAEVVAREKITLAYFFYAPLECAAVRPEEQLALFPS